MRYCCDSLRSFADWTWTSPVCIPSVILCAKVPCVVPLWSFPCLWRVQFGEVPSPYPTFPMRTATTWSPDGILVQWSGGYRSDAGENDDVFWNPFLWTLKFCFKIVDLWCERRHVNVEERHITLATPQFERKCCRNFILIWFLAQKLLQSAWILSRTRSIPAISVGWQIKRKHPGVVAQVLARKPTKILQQEWGQVSCKIEGLRTNGWTCFDCKVMHWSCKVWSIVKSVQMHRSARKEHNLYLIYIDLTLYILKALEVP